MALCVHHLQEESAEEVERRALSYVAEKKDRDAQEASKARAAEEAEVRQCPVCL